MQKGFFLSITTWQFSYSISVALDQPAQTFSRTRAFVERELRQTTLSHFRKDDWLLVHASGNMPLVLCIGSWESLVWRQSPALCIARYMGEYRDMIIRLGVGVSADDRMALEIAKPAFGFIWYHRIDFETDIDLVPNCAIVVNLLL